MNVASASSLPTLLGFVTSGQDQLLSLLPVDPGLTVLYGLNGAGKTRTLDAIRSFWSGHSSHARALVELPQNWSISHDIDWYRETGRADWFPDWERRVGMAPTTGEPGEILRKWVRQSTESWNDWPESTGAPDPLRHDGYVSEWETQRLILIRAAGSPARPEWISAPACMTGVGTPHFNAAAELYESLAAMGYEDGESKGSLSFQPCATGPNGETFMMATQYGSPESQSRYSNGFHDQLIDMSVNLSEPADDVNLRTREYLADQVGDDHTAVVNGTVQASEQLKGRVHELEVAANRHYQGVLHDAPTLRLYTNVTGLDAGIDWNVADDDPSFPDDPADPRRPLAQLSSAQQRWAAWSVNAALDDLAPSDHRVRLVLLDEPEAALHRSAEAHMAARLADLSRLGDRTLVVATHSPELMDAYDATLLEVRREHGRTQLSHLTTVDVENMRELGLEPSDLLRRQRGILLVEGVHDEVVLRELFKEQLGRLRVEVLPLRGTSQLSAAKIGFLFDHTRAHIFVMLDNLSTSEVERTWENALEVFRETDVSAAQDALDQSDALASCDEGKVLRELLGRIIEQGSADRFTPHGLTKKDIIEYFPVESFVPGVGSWQQLRESHEHARATKPGTTPKDFKKWLAGKHRADFSPDALREVVRTLDTIPADLLRLLKTVEARVSAR